MTHRRALLIGAFLGSAASFGTMAFIACQGSNDRNSASAAPGQKEKKDKKAPDEAKPKGPPQTPEELGAAVAVIDGYTITVDDLQERINNQSPYVRARYTSLERKKEVLDSLIRFEVLANEALRQGLDKDPEVVRAMKQVMIQKLLKHEFDTRVKPSDVSEAEMRAWYEANSAQYNTPEMVRVAAIILRDKAQADKIAAEAKAKPDLKKFRELVTKYSEDDATKTRGGDLKYFAQDSKDIPPEVIKEAWTLAKTGDVTGPVKTSKGYFIIMQTGRRKPVARSFDEVKRGISNQLFKEKRDKAIEDFVKGLRGKAKITIDEKALAAVRVDTSIPAKQGHEHEDKGTDLGQPPGNQPE
jgi:peptidyl-prolyl cis-trans isomerase C